MRASTPRGGGSRLLVVDDGSKDDTFTILNELSENHEFLDVVRKDNGGHGSAVLHGYRYALAHSADYVFQTDSDGQTDPDEFDRFWVQRDDYDAVFGNRVTRGDGRHRAFVEKVVCFLVRAYFGVNVPDANAPFRLMQSSYVKELLPFIPEDYGLPNIALTALGVKFGKRVRFEEISFGARETGSNSINVKRIVGIGWHSLWDFARIRKQARAAHAE